VVAAERNCLYYEGKVNKREKLFWGQGDFAAGENKLRTKTDGGENECDQQKWGEERGKN